MLYLTCPSCGTFLGLYTNKWETESEIICNNSKLTKEEKEKQKTELLLSLNLRRYCCKMRIMSYKDIVQDILQINQETI